MTVKTSSYRRLFRSQQEHQQQLQQQIDTQNPLDQDNLVNKGISYV